MVRPLPQPRLEAKRLWLRPFSPADAGTVQGLAGAREVATTTLNIPHPYADGMAEAWIQHPGRRVAGTIAEMGRPPGPPRVMLVSGPRVT